MLSFSNRRITAADGSSLAPDTLNGEVDFRTVLGATIGESGATADSGVRGLSGLTGNIGVLPAIETLGITGEIGRYCGAAAISAMKIELTIN